MKELITLILCLVMLIAYILPIELSARTNNIRWLWTYLISLAIAISGVAILRYI